MGIQIEFSEDAAFVLSLAGGFLASQPVLHNLILTILHARVAQPESGRYWVAMERGEVVGVVLQSPPTFAATLTPMDGQVAGAMVDAIADAGIELPGVSGEAATAASFAGRWSERRNAAATPFQGNRLYELQEAGMAAGVGGELRQACAGDRNLTLNWMRAFQAEVGEPGNDTEVRVERWLAAGEVWLWEDGEPMSMALSRTPLEGVVRLSGVYTPVDRRRRGFGESCVYALSKCLREAGFRCVLYTDLGNPTSNSIYRRIGYRAVAEVLRYRFE
jgi:ribosomal protein S18 acetylase RimI-like enzyme